MSKHTATPWILEFDTPVDMCITDKDGHAIDGVRVWLDDACRENNSLRAANAAHIVKCVNMHDEILDFLANRFTGDHIECHCDPTDNYECDKHAAERLLAQAGGEG